MQTSEQATGRVTNPLGLDVTWEWGTFNPPHEAWDGDRRDKLAASMRTDGWIGPPLVVWDENSYTGSHRIMARHDADLEQIPTVDLWELCEKVGVDFGALMDEHEGSDREAFIALCQRGYIAEDILEAYGMDAC